MAAALSGPLHIARTAGGAEAWIGDHHDVAWPEGFAVRFDPAELVDETGTSIAVESEGVVAAGGWDDDGTFWAGPVEPEVESRRRNELRLRQLQDTRRRLSRVRDVGN